MKVEVLFHTSSSPKIINATAIYTKDGLLCLSRKDGLIYRFPLCNVFSVCSWHKQHTGTSIRSKN